LKGADVVAKITPSSIGEITVNDVDVTIEETVADPITVEQPSQEKWHGVTHRVSLASELAKTNFEALNLAVVTDEFDADTFAENVDIERHIEEDDRTARSESNEENMQSSVDTAPDAAVDPGGEGNETHMPSSSVNPCHVPTSSRIDWSSYYTYEELRALKLKLINLQDYPNHKGISYIESIICDSAVVNVEGNPRVREEVIKKGELFESLDVVKLFFRTMLYVTIDHTMWPSQTKTYVTS
jgi:hypothetical protein